MPETPVHTILAQVAETPVHTILAQVAETPVHTILAQVAETERSAYRFNPVPTGSKSGGKLYPTPRLRRPCYSRLLYAGNSVNTAIFHSCSFPRRVI